MIEFPVETYAFPIMHEVPVEDIIESKWVVDGKTIHIDMNVNAYRDKEKCRECVDQHCLFILQVQMHEMKQMAARLERNLASTVFEHTIKNTVLNFGIAVKETLQDLMDEI